MQLVGKTVLVTGAAKRIGREIALALARRGANIIVHHRTSAAAARQVVAEIERLGVHALAVRADQTDARQVQRAVQQGRQRFGEIHVLINSAAVYERTPFATLTERDWDFHLDANLKGPFLFAREVGQGMRRGHIINFADWAGWRPYRHYLPYCVSKAGVIALTKALAKELAPRVQVNAIAPGPVLLPADVTPRERRAIVRATLLKRLGTPQDIVNAVLFLLEGGDFITGHTLVVDGGRLLAGDE
jgi:NAD(P)-dependent dehydrogenase (short-subunit alcohol dehydrogenase family)